MINSFYPVVPGRTSNAQANSRALYQLQIDQIGIQDAQTQLTTGLRFQRPSEDPSAAIRVIGLQSAQEFKAQAILNLKSSQSFLSASESTLGQLQDLVIEAKGTAISAVDSTLSDTERDAVLAQINELLSRVVALGNTRQQDRYLLGGGGVSRQPISLENDGVRFLGNNLSLLSVADQNDYLAHNVTAQQALGVVSESAFSTIDLDPGVLSTTRLSDLNSGLGIAPGAFSLSDGNEQATVDISGAETLQDIVDRLSNVSLSDRRIVASLGPTGLQVNYEDLAGGTLRISDIGTGRSAADLGIATNTPTPTLPIDGNDLNPILRLSSTIDQLNAGTGFDLTGGIQIQQGDQLFQVDLSNANTVEDILNTILRSGAGVTAELAPDGQSIQIRSIKSGVSFSIGEDGGDLAERLGVRTFTSQTRLSQLNFGSGISFSDGAELTIGRVDGSDLAIHLEGAVTIQDVLDQINNHTDNQVVGNIVVASINEEGNGITLTSDSTSATSALSIRNASGSEVANLLGLIPKGQTQATAVLDGTDYKIVGGDPNPQEVEGIYNSLIRLREAVRTADYTEISRAATLIDQDSDRLALARGAIGVRQQRADALINAAEETNIQLKSQESDSIDADLASVISDLTARQVALQASLSLLGQTSKLSLFDYL